MFATRLLLAQSVDATSLALNGAKGAAPFDEETQATVFEAVRLEALGESWQIALLVAVSAVVATFCWWMYKRDSVDLGPGYSWMLLGLRIGTLVGMLCYWVQYEKRVDRIETDGSRVLLLVDTSASMSHRDSNTDEVAPSLKTAKSRIDQVIDELAAGPLINRLRHKHDVHILSFDQHPKATQVVSLPRTTAPSGVSNRASLAPLDNEPIRSVRSFFTTLANVVPTDLWWALGSVLVGSAVLCILWLVQSRKHPKMGVWQIPWIMLGCLMPAVPIIVLIMLIVEQRNAIEQEFTSSPRLRIAQDATQGIAVQENSNTTGLGSAHIKPTSGDSWQTTLRERLLAEGAETRLGDVLGQLIHEERNQPTAGLIVFTDGGLNAGAGHLAAVEAAKQAGIPIYPVGMGSNQKQKGLRISDFDTPARVFPDDDFTVTATVQSTGFVDQRVNVQLVSTSDAARQNGVEQIEQTKRIKLGEDGESSTVKFVVTPEGIGRKTYIVRVGLLRGDPDAQDNEAFATVEVIDRKLRILLFAGGPNREYRYLRNQLYRDKDVKLDVLLQTSPPGPGISQDADRILADFPREKEDLDQYDGIVAFDPDWRILNAEQVELLENWVGEDAGGLIVVAGPVYTATWASDPKAGSHMSKIRALYPVRFPSRNLMLASDLEKFRSKSPWALQLTRAGLESPFMRLEDSVALSEVAWSNFEGVYGYFPVSGHKPGATVYAHYDTPDAGDDLPVYFAGQFYGSGRVYYMGSGEMWRIRAVGEAYFETYYTKLIRHVCEGRLLRGARRGVLLLEKRKFVKGQTVDVQAVMKNADMKPLEAPQVPLLVTLPDGQSTTVEMVPHAARKGMYRGDFQASLEGNYRLELQIPSAPTEMVTDAIRVLQPDLENDFSRRDDAKLSAIADGSGGSYYVGIKSLGGSSKQVALASQLRDATRHPRVKGTPSAEWDLRWAYCLLCVITGMLFLEWTMRRLVKLA